MNPQYDSIFTFVNDYAALLPDPAVGAAMPVIAAAGR